METTEIIEKLKREKEELKEEMLNQKLDRIQKDVDNLSGNLKQFLEKFNEMQTDFASVPGTILALTDRIAAIEKETLVVRFLTKNPKVAVILLAGIVFMATYQFIFSQLFHTVK